MRKEKKKKKGRELPEGKCPGICGNPTAKDARLLWEPCSDVSHQVRGNADRL